MSIDWTLLDVAISLVAVYFTFSLLVSWLNEQVATMLQLRATTLSDGLMKLLHDAALTNAVFRHPVVSGSTNSSDRLPSYLSAQQFSTALIGILTAGKSISTAVGSAFTTVTGSIDNLPDQLKVKSALVALVNRAGGDYNGLIKAIEDWYDDHMDRVTGWYRRTSSKWLFVLGLAVVCFFDIDTIALIPAFKSASIPVNCTFSNGNAPTTSDVQCISATVVAQIRGGWKDDPLLKATGSDLANGILSKVLGLILSACALSLGSPFWFDILKQLTNVRNAGVKPDVDRKGKTPAPAL